MVELRDYQKDIVKRGTNILQEYKMLLLWMEVRTGKTLTSMSIAWNYGAKKVLFVTKKKAIPSIQSDYDLLEPGYDIYVINYESLHKVPNWNFDFVIVDESHSLGAFPKPSKRTTNLKEFVGQLPVIYLSGTPTPESWSQIFHQLWVSDHSPWNQYANFYRWADDFVEKYEKYINGRNMTFYDKADRAMIDEDTAHLTISFSQKDAGFNQVIEEEIIWLNMPPKLQKIYQEIEEDEVYIGANFTVACSNAADRVGKMSQICGDTIISDDGVQILDTEKAVSIGERFHGRKIAIFYKYQAERTILESVLPRTTDIPEEFNTTDIPVFLGQIQSIREGVNLKAADCLVMYNIDFSATSYWQARARLQSKDREKPAKVYWIFYRGGIESYVYKAVQNKVNFTASYYRKNRKTQVI